MLIEQSTNRVVTMVIMMMVTMMMMFVVAGLSSDVVGFWIELKERTQRRADF